MAANRYTNLGATNYQSMYVPLPFQELALVGEKKQRDLDNELKSGDAASSALLKPNLTASLHLYDPNSPSKTSTYDISFLEKQRREKVEEFNNKKKKLVDDFYDHKINEREFKKQNQSLITDAANTYNKFNTYSEVLNQVNDFNKKLSENKEFAKDSIYGTHMLTYNKKFLNDLANGNLYSYNPRGIAEKYDESIAINNDMSGWKSTDLGSGIGVNNGFIKKYTAKGITGTEVYSYVENAWKDGHAAKDFADLKLNETLELYGIDGNKEIEYQDYKKDSSGNIIYEKGKPIIETKKGKYADIFMEQEKQKYANALAEKLVHKFVDNSWKADPYSFKEWSDKKEKEKNTVDWTVKALSGEPLSDEERTKMLPEDIQRFYNIKDGKIEEKIIFPSNEKGTVSGPHGTSNFKDLVDSKSEFNKKSADEKLKIKQDLIVKYGLQKEGENLLTASMHFEERLNNLVNNYTKNARYTTQLDATVSKDFVNAYFPKKNAQGVITNVGSVNDFTVESLDGKDVEMNEEQKVDILSRASDKGITIDPKDGNFIISVQDKNDPTKSKNYKVVTNNVTMKENLKGVVNMYKNVQNNYFAPVNKEKIVTKEANGVKVTGELVDTRDFNGKTYYTINSKNREGELITTVFVFNPKTKEMDIEPLHNVIRDMQQEALSPIIPNFNDKRNETNKSNFLENFDGFSDFESQTIEE